MNPVPRENSKSKTSNTEKLLIAVFTFHIYGPAFVGIWGPSILPDASLWLFRLLSIPLLACLVIGLFHLVLAVFNLQVSKSRRLAFTLVVSLLSCIDGPVLVGAANIYFAPNTLQTTTLVGHTFRGHGKHGEWYGLNSDDWRGPAVFGSHVGALYISKQEYEALSALQPPFRPAAKVTVRQGLFGAPFRVSYEILPDGVSE